MNALVTSFGTHGVEPSAARERSHIMIVMFAAIDHSIVNGTCSASG
jgi:hypothetical protein